MFKTWKICFFCCFCEAVRYGRKSLYDVSKIFLSYCQPARNEQRPGYVSSSLPRWPGRALCLGKEPEWHSKTGVRWAALDVPRTGKTGFTLLPPEQTGIRFTNTLTEWQSASNRVLLNGSGVAVGDYDNDGLPDIYFCGLDTPNVLYKNLGD
jgi:hypothetical protein